MEPHDKEQLTKNLEDSSKDSLNNESLSREESPHVYEFGDFRLDTENTTSYRLFRNGQPQRIQNKQFSLLCALVENHGRELSTAELIGYLWKDHVVDDSNREYYVDRLHHHVHLLRNQIGKESIKFRKGLGYFCAAEVRVVPLPPTPLPVYPDFEFNRWLFYSRECRSIKLFLVTGVAVSLLYSISYVLRSFMHYQVIDRLEPGMALCGIQFVVVLGALFASYSVFDRNVKEFPASGDVDAALMKICGYADPKKWMGAKLGAKSSLKNYSRYWKLLLTAWSCLYFLLILTIYSKGARGKISPEAEQNPLHPFWTLNIASTVFNNLNSLAITLCFVVLNHPTSPKWEDTGLDRVTKQLKKWGPTAIIVFALVESLLVYLPVSKWFAPLSRANVLWTFDLVSGVGGAVTLAFFVGRIQSKFLGPSTWLPLALYLYVAIQSLYVAALQGSKWGPFVVEAALILKCLLYLYVAWLFKSGRLLFYLVRVKTVYERVNIEWQEFLANLNRKS